MSNLTERFLQHYDSPQKAQLALRVMSPAQLRDMIGDEAANLDENGVYDDVAIDVDMLVEGNS